MYYPVDLQKCQNHRLANIMFKDSGEDQPKSIYKKKCECCGKVIGMQPQTTICYDSTQLAVFGPGVPLYFLFLKYILKILLVCFIIFGIYAFISNLNEYQCSLYKRCKLQDFFTNSSIMNGFSSEEVVLTQKYIILGLLLILLVIMQWVRYQIKQQQQLIDQFLITPSDYAIILRRLPKDTQQSDIRKMLYESSHFLDQNQKRQSSNLAIRKIVFAKDLTQYNEIMIQNLQNFKQSVSNNEEFQKLKVPNINKNLSTAIVIFQKQISKQYFSYSSHGGQAIIKYFWYGYKPLSNQHRVKGQFISIQRAPQPDDIIWQNCGYSMWSLFTKKIAFFGVSVIVLCIGGLIQFLLIKWRVNNIQQGNSTLLNIFSVVSALLITVLNYVIEVILIKTSSQEMLDTRTQLKISLTTKIVFFQFLNSGIALTLINAFAYLPDFKSYKSMITSDIISLMVINAIVNNVMVFFITASEINTFWQRYKLQNQKQVFTQLEANKIYEAPPAQLQYKYAIIFKTFWLTAFFFPTVPLVIIISFLGLLLNYFIELYLFSGKYSIPNMFSSKLSISIMNLLNYSFLWLTLGSFMIHLLKSDFTYNKIPTEIMIPHYLCFIISIIAIVTPINLIGNACFSKNQQPIIMNKLYSQYQGKFQSTYEQTNPAYNGGTIYLKKQLGTNQKVMEKLFTIPTSHFYREINN